MKQTIIVLVLFFFIPTFVNAQINFVQIMCNPEGSDSLYEWVRLKNFGTTAVDITGWKFNDGSNHTLNAPPKNGGKGDLIIDVGETFMLANKAGDVNGENTVIDTVMSLANAGDTVSIIDTDGNTMDTVSYGGGHASGELCFGGGTDNGGSSENSTTTSTSTSATTTKVVTVTKEVTKYHTVTIEPPRDIFLRVPTEIHAFSEEVIDFSVETYDAMGTTDLYGQGLSVVWSFGDGKTSQEMNPKHRYAFDGVYTVSVTAQAGTLVDKKKTRVVVEKPELAIRIDGKREYIEIFNYSQYDINLEGWRLRAGYIGFDFSHETILAGGESIKLSTRQLGFHTIDDEEKVILFTPLHNEYTDTKKYIQKINEEDTQDREVPQVASSTEKAATSARVEQVIKTPVVNIIKKKKPIAYQYKKRTQKHVIIKEERFVKDEPKEDESEINMEDIVYESSNLVPSTTDLATHRKYLASASVITEKTNHDYFLAMLMLVFVSMFFMFNVESVFVRKEKNPADTFTIKEI